ncbi:MAG: hypothetical protein ACLPJH_17660 [Myxococcaceae bacterium]
MASLQALEDAVESLCHAMEQALAEEAMGHREHADLGALERAHPLAVSAQTLAAVRAAAGSSRTPDAQRPRLKALAPFVARAAVAAAARAADDALETAWRTTTVRAAGARWPLPGVWSAVAEEADRPRRTALARAAAEAEEGLGPAAQRRWEAAHQAARSLEVEVAVPSASLAAEAADFLRSTEDGWRDVLGYACRQLAPGLRPLPHGEAGLHDVLRLRYQPLPGAFPSQEALQPVRSWLDASGLTLAARGHVRVAEDTTGRLPEAAAFAVEVPGHVFLVQPTAGRGAFGGLLAAAGRARARAAVAPSASLAARRLGDEAVRASAGWLVQGVLLSQPWLRRFLGHGKPAAREVARLAALAQLGELRLWAALLPLAPGWLHSGPTPAALETAAAAAEGALWVAVPKGALLPALAGTPQPAEQLRAAALAEGLRRTADERFDAEDFRNPAAAGWLSSVWARGTDVDADALARDVCGAPLSLAPLGGRLLAVLGA